MSGTDSMDSTAANVLNQIASALTLLLGLLLFAGAAGHLGAVWPGLDVIMQAESQAERALLWPGLTLLLASLLNGVLAFGLWQARRGARWLGLLGNGLLAAYLIGLLVQGVPGHPIGVFLALVASQLIVLLALEFGLVLRTSDSPNR